MLGWYFLLQEKTLMLWNNSVRGIKMQNKELQMFVSAVFAGLLYYLGIVSNTSNGTSGNPMCVRYCY